jgi:exopolyphosphatase/pppGpp-phosphohydrolase
MFGTIPEPDSAYDELVSQMYHAEGGFIWTPEEAQALVDAVLREAAEKVRCADAPDDREDTFDAGAVWASELIRPKENS